MEKRSFSSAEIFQPIGSPNCARARCSRAPRRTPCLALWGVVIDPSNCNLSISPRTLSLDSEVFVNFVDHGGVGLVAFPTGPVLHVKDLGGEAVLGTL